MPPLVLYDTENSLVTEQHEPVLKRKPVAARVSKSTVVAWRRTWLPLK
jgi:hypothetical protein